MSTASLSSFWQKSTQDVLIGYVAFVRVVAISPVVSVRRSTGMLHCIVVWLDILLFWDKDTTTNNKRQSEEALLKYRQNSLQHITVEVLENTHTVYQVGISKKRKKVKTQSEVRLSLFSNANVFLSPPSLLFFPPFTLGYMLRSTSSSSHIATLILIGQGSWSTRLVSDFVIDCSPAWEACCCSSCQTAAQFNYLLFRDEENEDEQEAASPSHVPDAYSRTNSRPNNSNNTNRPGELAAASASSFHMVTSADGGRRDPVDHPDSPNPISSSLSLLGLTAATATAGDEEGRVVGESADNLCRGERVPYKVEKNNKDTLRKRKEEEEMKRKKSKKSKDFKANRRSERMCPLACALCSLDYASVWPLFWVGGGGLGTCGSALVVRQILRKRYGIYGDSGKPPLADSHACEDCCVVCFCHRCAVAQHHREMTLRGDAPGGVLIPKALRGVNNAASPHHSYSSANVLGPRAHPRMGEGGGHRPRRGSSGDDTAQDHGRSRPDAGADRGGDGRGGDDNAPFPSSSRIPSGGDADLGVFDEREGHPSQTGEMAYSNPSSPAAVVQNAANRRVRGDDQQSILNNNVNTVDNTQTVAQPQEGTALSSPPNGLHVVVASPRTNNSTGLANSTAAAAAASSVGGAEMEMIRPAHNLNATVPSLAHTAPSSGHGLVVDGVPLYALGGFGREGYDTSDHLSHQGPGQQGAAEMSGAHTNTSSTYSRRPPLPLSATFPSHSPPIHQQQQADDGSMRTRNNNNNNNNVNYDVAATPVPAAESGGASDPSRVSSDASTPYRYRPSWWRRSGSQH